MSVIKNEIHHLLNRGPFTHTVARQGESLNLKILKSIADHRPTPVVDLNQKQREAYSISRAILNIGASFEQDVSEEIARNLPKSVVSHGGIYIPNFMISRALNTDGIGQQLVFTEAGSFIEALRKKARVLAMGATFLFGLKSDVGLPRETNAIEPQWVDQNAGVDNIESDPALDLVLLKPQILSGTTSFSRQLLAQSTPQVDQVVTNILATGSSLALDRASLHGTGMNAQPKGIYSSVGVHTENFAGPVSYAHVVSMEKQVANANADVGPMGYITTPNVRHDARLTPLFSGTIGSDAVPTSSPLWTGGNEDGRMNGYPAAATNQVSGTLGTGADQGIVFGAWPDLLVGEWGATEIIADPYSRAARGMIRVTSFLLAGIALRHGESFCKGAGLTAS